MNAVRTKTCWIWKWRGDAGMGSDKSLRERETLGDRRGAGRGDGNGSRKGGVVCFERVLKLPARKIRD